MIKEENLWLTRNGKSIAITRIEWLNGKNSQKIVMLSPSQIIWPVTS